MMPLLKLLHLLTNIGTMLPASERIERLRLRRSRQILPVLADKGNSLKDDKNVVWFSIKLFILRLHKTCG